jgi:hypothetical protein
MKKQTLKVVPVSKLLPNPFRNIKNYPIDQTKVEQLIESFRETGVWPNIEARAAKGGKFEIAYGHHRREAMKQEGIKTVAIVVSDMTDEVIFKKMVRENDEVYGTSAYGDIENVEQAVAGFADGKWEFPEVPGGTDKRYIRTTGGARRALKYTERTLAIFLGKTIDDGRPAEPVKVGFDVLDAINDKLLTRNKVKGLSRNQAKAIVKSARKIEQVQKELAEQRRVDAERARQLAEEEEDASKKRARERAAEQLEEIAQVAEALIVEAPADFIDAVIDDVKSSDMSVRDVASEAMEIITELRGEIKEKEYKNVAGELKHYAGEVAGWLNDEYHSSTLEMLKLELVPDDISAAKREAKRLLTEVKAVQKRADKFARILEGWKSAPPVQPPSILKITG